MSESNSFRKNFFPKNANFSDKHIFRPKVSSALEPVAISSGQMVEKRAEKRSELSSQRQKCGIFA